MGRESQHRASLGMNRRIYGEHANHPDIGTSRDFAGNMTLQRKGDFDEAASQYRASLGIMRRIQGEHADHPHIASLLDLLLVVAL